MTTNSRITYLDCIIELPIRQESDQEKYNF